MTCKADCLTSLVIAPAGDLKLDPLRRGVHEASRRQADGTDGGAEVDGAFQPDGEAGKSVAEVWCVVCLRFGGI